MTIEAQYEGKHVRVEIKIHTLDGLAHSVCTNAESTLRGGARITARGLENVVQREIDAATPVVP